MPERLTPVDVALIVAYNVRSVNLGRSGGMADAPVSKTGEGDLVWVRPPPSAMALGSGSWHDISAAGRFLMWESEGGGEQQV